MQESLDAGKIDIGQFPQPFAALAEKQMKVRKIFDAKYGIPFEEELTVLVGKDLNEYSLDTVKMFYDDAQRAGFTLDLATSAQHS